MRWIRFFSAADSNTKMFIFTCFVYGIVMVATTVYCYARLDYVRSYETVKK